MDISLRKGEVVSIKGSLRGITVRCDEGTIWVTVAGDSEDYILRRGSELSVARRGTVAIVAEEESSVRFYKPVKVNRNARRPAWKTIEFYV